VRTTTCLAAPVALANSPVPPVTVTVFITRYRVYEDVVANTHTVPFKEVVNWLPSDAVAVTKPVTELLAPEPHGGGGLAAICDPLVVPRVIGVPYTVPMEVVTSLVVDVIVPLPIST
jgi:hypothetical protein